MTEQMESWWRTAVSVAQVGLITIYYMLSARVNDVKEQLARVEAATFERGNATDLHDGSASVIDNLAVNTKGETNNLEVASSGVRDKHEVRSESNSILYAPLVLWQAILKKR